MSDSYSFLSLLIIYRVCLEQNYQGQNSDYYQVGGVIYNLSNPSYAVQPLQFPIFDIVLIPLLLITFPKIYITPISNNQNIQICGCIQLNFFQLSIYIWAYYQQETVQTQFETMNRQKLIALMIKKQTYKDTKIVQADIAKKKQQAVNISISAIYHIFKDSYDVEAKLYAARFLKDCFEKGNQTFISKTQQKLLPFLVKFVQDSHDDKAIQSYRGPSTADMDMNKFQQLATSLFTLSRECIEKWAIWLCDPTRQFLKTHRKIEREFGQYTMAFRYFRSENQTIFRENCEKNGFLLPLSSKSPQENYFQPKISQTSKSVNQSSQPFQKAPNTIKPSQNIAKINHILQKIKNNIDQIDSRQFQDLQKQFNSAINEYIQQSDVFDQNFINQSIEQFEDLKFKFQTNSKKNITQKPMSFANTSTKKTKTKDVSKVQYLNSNDPHKKDKYQEPVKDIDIQKVSTENKRYVPVPPSKTEISMKNIVEEQRVNFDMSDSQSDKDQSAFIKKQKQRNTAKFGTEQNKIEMPPRQSKKVQSQNKQFPVDVVSYRNQQEENLKQKQQMSNKLKQLERQIFLLQQSENKLIGQLQVKDNYSIEFNTVKQQLLNEKNDKNNLFREVSKLKDEMLMMKEQFTKKQHSSINFSSPQKIESSRYNENPINLLVGKQNYKSKKINSIITQKQQSQRDKIEEFSKISSIGNDKSHSTRIDQDYIEGRTHSSVIGSWLSSTNVERFKLCVLGLSQIFYENQNITMSTVNNLFSEERFDYLKMTYSYKFKRYQNIIPKVTYKNIPEIDLWTKPLKGKKDSYMQQTVGKLCSVPLKIMKASLNADNNVHFNYLLPFMYYNYLRTTEFQLNQFQEVFVNKHQSIIKSKVFFLDCNISDSPKKYSKIFRNSSFRNNFLEFCLEQQSYERVFMTQIEFLKNQKAIIRILPIPTIESMTAKAKQLLNNLIFLIGQ